MAKLRWREDDWIEEDEPKHDDPPCQWKTGDKCMFRMYGNGEPIAGYVTAVDIPTRRLRICYGPEGDQTWQYMEWAWKP